MKIKVKDIMYKSYYDLEPQEKRFYTINQERYELNMCDECDMIDSTYELFWDCDFDLKGHTCLCEICYEKIVGFEKEGA
jgi:hypothetical protein